MIHHMSFALPDPASAAPKLAVLTGGTAFRAPTPPFPQGTWLLVLGNAVGGMLELLPEAFVLDPDVPLGFGRRDAPVERSAAHVLVTSPLRMSDILELAAAEGWRADAVDSGLFEIAKVWVQGAFLVEFIPEEKLSRYTQTFGANGLATLDGKLRALEEDLVRKLGAVMSRERLAALLQADPA
jgi:hypothetical protein